MKTECGIIGIFSLNKDNLIEELIDRFGAIPIELMRIITIQKIYIMCKKTHIDLIEEKKQNANTDGGGYARIRIQFPKPERFHFVSPQSRDTAFSGDPSHRQWVLRRVRLDLAQGGLLTRRNEGFQKFHN